MVYNLLISKEADEDIDNIAQYIAVELTNPTAASAFLNDVDKCYHNVIHNPHMYNICNDERLCREGYRKIVIKNYLILYRIDEEQKIVFIVRVVYVGMNYAELL